MKTKEILENINDNGGFDNFNHWTEKEIAEWVKASFECSTYVAKKVAAKLK